MSNDEVLFRMIEPLIKLLLLPFWLLWELLESVLRQSRRSAATHVGVDDGDQDAIDDLKPKHDALVNLVRIKPLVRTVAAVRSSDQDVSRALDGTEDRYHGDRNPG
jgi:hypothetical protein